MLQWDPPASASAFVHRVGRTARQGQLGSALLLLLENEEAYVSFIENNQRVKLIPTEDLASDKRVRIIPFKNFYLFFMEFNYLLA